MYKLLVSPEEIEKHLVPVLKANGSEIPKRGCYIAAVEFDEKGEVLAYQMAQNALFLEGLWARDKSARLLPLHHILCKYLTEKLNADRLMTMVRNDETGRRIGRLAQKLGFEKVDWLIFRRKVCR